MTKYLNDRIEYLKDAGAEEGIAPVIDSEKDLRLFADAFGDPLAVFLSDNGNYRARWHNEKLSTSLEFMGAGTVKALHLPKAKPAPEQPTDQTVHQDHQP